RVHRIVCDAEKVTLGQCDGRSEFAGVELVVSPVVEGYPEVPGGGNAKGHSSKCAGFIMTGGHSCHCFGPRVVGCHAPMTDAASIRGTSDAARAALVASTEPGRATARVASSITRVSKPSCLPSIAEKRTQKS